MIVGRSLRERREDNPPDDPGSRTVYITDTGDKYHRDGCRYLDDSRIPMTRRDAAELGNEACEVCRP